MRLAKYKKHTTLSIKSPANKAPAASMQGAMVNVPLSSHLWSPRARCAATQGCIYPHELSMCRSLTDNRFEGPRIEIAVGPHPSVGTEDFRFWTPPIVLLSRCSFFLRAACTHNFKEKQQNRIELSTDSAYIFSLFVQWLCKWTTTDLHETCQLIFAFSFRSR